MMQTWCCSLIGVSSLSYAQVLYASLSSVFWQADVWPKADRIEVLSGIWRHVGEHGILRSLLLENFPSVNGCGQVWNLQAIHTNNQELRKTSRIGGNLFRVEYEQRKDRVVNDSRDDGHWPE